LGLVEAGLALSAGPIDVCIIIAERAVVRIDNIRAFNTDIIAPNISRAQVAPDVIKSVRAGLTDKSVEEEVIAECTDGLICGLEAF
jgi:hypothetical protein